MRSRKESMRSLRSMCFTFNKFDSNYRISHLIDDSGWIGDTERAQLAGTYVYYIFTLVSRIKPRASCLIHI